MKFTVLAVVFFLVLSFSTFGQNVIVEDARAAGYNAGLISGVPSPSVIPDRYKQNSALEKAYIEGFQDGYRNKQYLETAERGYRFDPYVRGQDQTFYDRDGRSVTRESTEAGIDFVIPFSTW